MAGTNDIQRELKNGIQGSSTGTIERIAGKLVALIGEVTKIIVAYSEREASVIDSQNLWEQQTKDSPENRDQELGSGRSKVRLQTDATRNQGVKKPLSIEEREEDVQSGIDTDLQNQLTDDEVVLQEIAEQLNEKIQRFVQEAMTMLRQSSTDQASNPTQEEPMKREQALQVLRDLVAQLQDHVRDIPGVKVDFFDLMSQLLKDPSTKQKSTRESMNRTQIRPMSPTESDGPSTFTKLMARVKEFFGGKSKEERTRT